MEWIKCDKRLPEYFKDVLVLTPWGCAVEQLEDVLDGEPAFSQSGCGIEYWMKLPEPPKE